jgi:hypothetical protein
LEAETAMTSSTARARARSIEERLGGSPGDLVAAEFFDPRETAERVLTGELTSELLEQVAIMSEFLPRARLGEHDCLFCRKPLNSMLALIGRLELPGRPGRAAFGVCEPCAGPNIQERLLDRLDAHKVAVN